jgi:hypothetical protein
MFTGLHPLDVKWASSPWAGLQSVAHREGKAVSRPPSCGHPLAHQQFNGIRLPTHPDNWVNFRLAENSRAILRNQIK